ncbi:UBN2 domain-containing protein [Cephalotus follicularis]|uniref:UBN2 domain-containing protein n=1 Tax=Cephalotus follicularis TaxID=3775 RepID=A0A1Q3DKK0_CEPFO|nr:UBN2 domain-containing protein [Cephalotus follicularis]
MWDLLEVTYEGTNQVKESKISMLVHEYELFMMHDNESISDMFTRFTTIINSLTAIEEAKDLFTLSLEQLLGSLMTHETTMKNYEHVEVKKKKSIAFKASKEDSESDEDGDVALITSQFKSDEEVAHIAYMAIEDEEENEVKFTFDELQNAYENLYVEYENVCLKNKTLKKNAISMSKDIDDLKSENSKYLNEIESLKDKNRIYMNEIEILNVSSKLSIDSLEENEKLKIEIDALKKTFLNFLIVLTSWIIC